MGRQCGSYKMLPQNHLPHILRSAFFHERLPKDSQNGGCIFDVQPSYVFLQAPAGEERCVDFRDANGVSRVHYTYCSIRGKLFNCTCCTKDEAQRLCEDWLIKQDRCYIN